MVGHHAVLPLRSVCVSESPPSKLQESLKRSPPDLLLGRFGKFQNPGREFAAWMGVVPREHSTGGKQKLLGISKRGNSYLRRLFVQGARAVLQQRTKQSSGLSAWLAQLTSRTHRNIAAVALANKLARLTLPRRPTITSVLPTNHPERPQGPLQGSMSDSAGYRQLRAIRDSFSLCGYLEAWPCQGR